MSDNSDILDHKNPVPEWGPAGSTATSFASAIRIEHISHHFSGTPVLHDVSFDIAPGEIVCLLGPSGCGKTTMLRILAGIEQAQKGRILIDDKEVSGPNNFVLPEKRNIGLVFQDYALFPHLSILENVMFGLRHLKKDLALIEARLTLKRVGMSEYEKAYPHMLSGGEQQRIALARAIAPRPAILLMDEPFSGLDHRLRDVVRAQTLNILKETGASAIIVTHDPEEAMFMADRIILMRDGKIAQIGSPDELYREPVDSQAAQFFSDVNIISGEVSKGKVVTPLGTLKAANFKDGTQVDILIRPEAFYMNGNKGHEVLVKEVRFLGNYYDASILVKDYPETLNAKIHTIKAIKKGEVINLSLNTDKTYIFEKQ